MIIWFWPHLECVFMAVLYACSDMITCCESTQMRGVWQTVSTSDIKDWILWINTLHQGILNALSCFNLIYLIIYQHCVECTQMEEIPFVCPKEGLTGIEWLESDDEKLWTIPLIEYCEIFYCEILILYRWLR